MDFEQGKKFSDQQTEGPQYIYISKTFERLLALPFLNLRFPCAIVTFEPEDCA